MKILVVKAVRDLWMKKLRSIALILAIAMSVGLGIGLVNATDDAFASFGHRYDVTNYEDIDIHFNMAHLNITELRQVDGVQSVVGRIFIPTQTQVGDKTYETQWISTPYTSEKPYSPVNGYQMVKGKQISSANATECVIGIQFARANHVKVSDTVTVLYGNYSIPLKVTGIASSPEYIYVVSGNGWPQPSKLLPLFTSYEMTANALNITPGDYNEIVVKVKEGFSAEDVKGHLESLLESRGIKVTQSILGTQEPDYQFSHADAGSLDDTGWAFGVIILFVAAVVIFNTMTRLIDSQRGYIGVMQALGGKMRDIVFHYTLFGFFLGTLGSLLGILLGIWISREVMLAYAGAIGLVGPVLGIYWQNVVFYVIVGITISTLGSFLGAVKATRIGPRDALTAQHHVQSFSGKPFIERLMDIIPGRRKLINKVPVRNIMGHKVRSGITVLALAASLIILFSSLGFALNFLDPLEKNYADYEKWDASVKLVDYMPQMSVESILASGNLSGLTGEPMLDDYAAVKYEASQRFVHVQAFAANSTLRGYHVIEGKKDFSKGVLAGSVIAKKMGWHVGTEITFILGNQTTTAKIVGITGEFMDDSVLMTLGQASSIMATHGAVNSIVFDLNGMQKSDFESRVRSAFPVSSIAYTEDVIVGMEYMLQGMMSMLYIFMIFSVLAEMLFVSTTVVLNVIDRQMEFISLRAMGASPSTIRRMVVTESTVLMLAGLVVGLPAGLMTINWAMAYMVKDLMYYELSIGANVYIAVSALAIISALIGAYISSRQIAGQSLSDTIRQRNIT